MSLRAKKFLIVFAGVTLLMNGALASSVVYATSHESASIPANTTAQERSSVSFGADSNALDMISCGSFWDKLTVSCIVPQLAYYLLYLPAMGVLMVTGELFDFVLSLSIDRDFIAQTFVTDLWTIVRDFSNMTFIFILLYTGIQTMFGLGGGWQKKIITIVILALIINFSMFFSKIIIDAGNTLAVGVYSGMGVVKTGTTVNQPHKKGGSLNAAERDVSSAFVGAFRPQKFANLAAQNNKGSAVIIFLVAAIVSGYVAWVLIKASLMFVGRIIAFWAYMIISPFALISMVLPKGNIFDKWLYGLIKQAMVAPVFLFFVYIIMTAVQGGKGANGILTNFGQATGSGGLFDNVLISIVLTGMIIYALNYALDIAKGMAGDFGKIGAQAATAVLTSFPTGIGAKLALGGAAGLLRSTVGQGASKVLNSGALGRMSTAGGLTGVLGRGLTRTAERTEKSSFDIRGTRPFEWGKGKIKSDLGVDINTGKAGGKGGWVGEQKTRKKEDDRQAERTKVSAQEKEAKVAKINPEYAGAKARVEKEYQEERQATFAHQEAKERANNTDEGKRVAEADVVHIVAVEGKKTAQKNADNSSARKGVKDAEENLNKTMGSTAKMEDKLAKAIERLKQEQAEAEKDLAFTTSERLKGEIEQAKKDEENAKKLAGGAIKNAQRELDDAQKVFDNSDEGKALADADKDLANAGRELKDAQQAFEKTTEGMELKVAKGKLDSASVTLNATREIIKVAEGNLKDWENTENERRREVIGRVRTFPRLYFTKADRQEAVNKIRAEKSKEVREKEEKKKEVIGIFEEVSNQVEKKKKKEEEAGGEEKPAEKGGEKK